MAKKVQLRPFKPRGLPGLPKLKNVHPRAGGTISASGTGIANIHPDLASSLSVVRVPGLRLEEYGEGGAASILTLKSKNIKHISEADLEPIRKIMGKVKQDAQNLSLGPLTLKILARMGHPYGFDKGTGRARKLPVRIGHVKGIKGYVTNLAIINIQTGDLHSSWSIEVEKVGDVVECRLINTVEYAWYLAHGTDKMQAHGPWVMAYINNWSRINEAWTEVWKKAGRKATETRIGEAASLTGGPSIAPGGLR